LISFTDWSIASNQRASFVGWQNYSEVVASHSFRWAFVRSFAFTFGAVAMQTVFGAVIAFALYRNFKGKRAVRTMMALPLIAAPAAIAAVFKLLFEGAEGFLNTILGGLGLPQKEWITSPETVLFSLALVDTWQWTAMVALIVLAGLSTLKREPFEAAKMDGAGSAPIFFRITLPLVMPVIVAAIVLRAADALKTYDIIAAMTAGGPGDASRTLMLYAFELSFVSVEYLAAGRAGVVLLFLFLLVLLFGVSVMRVREKLQPWSGAK
jgi:multiple sugar transport system permease protein